jgi:hypothetical protein
VAEFRIKRGECIKLLESVGYKNTIDWTRMTRWKISKKRKADDKSPTKQKRLI